MRIIASTRILFAICICRRCSGARRTRSSLRRSPKPPSRSATRSSTRRSITTSARSSWTLDDTKLYADDVWLYVDQNRAVATGNVVFRQGNNQIAADRADFNTKTRLGTFYNASGFATVQPPRQTVRPGRRGASAADGPGHDRLLLRRDGREDRPEKIQDHQWRLHHLRPADAAVGFQRRHDRAEPRSLHAAAQRGDERQGRAAVLPAGRSTTRRSERIARPGFSLPTYGTSSLRADSRFTTRSSGRSIAARTRRSCTTGSRRPDRASAASTATTSAAARMATSGPTCSTSTRRRFARIARRRAASYKLSGAANQLLPGGFRAQGARRLLLEHRRRIRRSTRHRTTRRATSGASAATSSAIVASYSLNGTIDRNEYLLQQQNAPPLPAAGRASRHAERTACSATRRSTSRPAASYANIISDRQRRRAGIRQRRAPARLLAAAPVSVQEVAVVHRQLHARAGATRSTAQHALDPLTVIRDRSVTKQPRDLDDNLNRQYFTLQAQMTGPVFNRIWDTPDNGYAEKFKHTDRTVPDRRAHVVDRRITSASSSSTASTGSSAGNTQYTYGVNNRFYAKRRSASSGQTGQAREISHGRAAADLPLERAGGAVRSAVLDQQQRHSETTTSRRSR